MTKAFFTIIIFTIFFFPTTIGTRFDLTFRADYGTAQRTRGYAHGDLLCFLFEMQEKKPRGYREPH